MASNKNKETRHNIDNTVPDQEDPTKFKGEKGVKADHDPSEIPGPTKNDTKSPEDDNDPHKEKSNIKGKQKKSKAQMTSEVLEILQNKRKVELESMMPDLMKALGEAADDDDDDYDNDTPFTGKKGSKSKDKDDGEDVDESKSKRHKTKVSKEDIDLEEDVRAMFGDEDLTEDFKNEATTVFEAAVVSKVNQVLKGISEDYERDLNEAHEEIVEDMSNKLDDYLDYVVENWMKENELAVSSGLQNELARSFMDSLKTVFENHYIDVPDSKVDVVEELSGKVEKLERELNEEVDKNVNYSKTIEELKREDVTDEVVEGLVDTDAEKLRSLAEGLDFEDEDQFRTKLNTLRKKYFGEGVGKTKSAVISEEVDDNPVDVNEENNDTTVPQHMKGYMSAISRTVRQ